MSGHFFRKNYTDFYVWCRIYVNRARWFISYYDSNDDSIWHLNHKENYLEAHNIIRQYEVIVAALPEEAVDYFERYLIGSNYREWKRHDPWIKEIFSVWLEVCFPENRPQIQSLDPITFGKTLKQYRERNGYTVSKVAELLEISQTTLRAYESGKSFMKVNMLYKISQLYGVNLDEILTLC